MLRRCRTMAAGLPNAVAYDAASFSVVGPFGLCFTEWLVVFPVSRCQVVELRKNRGDRIAAMGI